MKNFFLAACAALALAIPTIGTAQTYVFDRVIDGANSGNGGFSNPYALTVDGSGSLYVADTFNSRVIELNSNGNVIRDIGSPGGGNGNLSYPFDVAVGKDGNVYVADTANYRIAEFDSNGAFLRNIGSRGVGNGQFSVITGISTDSSGNVYAANNNPNPYLSGGNVVEEFDGNGSFLRNIGSSNQNVAQPDGLTVDSSGNIYVANHANTFNNSAPPSVVKFNSNGQVVATYMAYQFFGAPYDVAVNSKGNLFVLSANDDSVTEFDQKGVFIQRLTTDSTTVGSLFKSRGITVDSMDNVYIADAGNNRIVKFRNVDAVPEPGAFVFLAAGLAGGAFFLRKRRR